MARNDLKREGRRSSAHWTAAFVSECGLLLGLLRLLDRLLRLLDRLRASVLGLDPDTACPPLPAHLQGQEDAIDAALWVLARSRAALRMVVGLPGAPPNEHEIMLAAEMVSSP